MTNNTDSLIYIAIILGSIIATVSIPLLVLKLLEKIMGRRFEHHKVIAGIELLLFTQLIITSLWILRNILSPIAEHDATSSLETNQTLVVILMIWVPTAGWISIYVYSHLSSKSKNR